MSPAKDTSVTPLRQTRVLPVRRLNAPLENNDPSTDKYLAARWSAERARDTPEAKALSEAAEALRHADIPVAFPTETVYGLGADATRSEAVRGIYAAKQRPSDNPLIVHFASREHLLRLLGTETIPPIYEPLISRFWPGPLTIILPIPSPNPFAKEVTSTLTTFGARMPSSPLARLLIYLTDRPLAAPSANASTKPSPTTAQHVFTDMNGRIDMILDGGPCGVGLESTVVDGLSSPPAILRPGGISREELQAVPGWEDVQIAYHDRAMTAQEGAPRAPGMKYKHYSPKARVVLFAAGAEAERVCVRLTADLQVERVGADIRRVGVVRTTNWPKGLGIKTREVEKQQRQEETAESETVTISRLELDPAAADALKVDGPLEILDIDIGPSTESIARGLFSAFRALDDENVSTIYVEGISDTSGDLAAAVMNRVRKAAEVEVK